MSRYTRRQEGGTGRDASTRSDKASKEGLGKPSRGSPSRDTPAQRSALARDAMPAVSVTIDKGLGLDATAVAKVAHDAVKNGIGKPDQCAPPPLDSHRCVAMLSCHHATHLVCADITVSVVQADCVLVGGQPKSALAHVDSIGGNFAGFVKALCDGLAPMGVAAGNVTATFRSVGMKEFAMNGSPLG